ncbi:MAG: radical SAM protein [Desulfobacterales bacterium]|nr:radical SAM protein [Desulfobacterales bacterium]
MSDVIRYIAYIKELVKGRLSQKRTPILVTVCVTNRCNLRCRYCYEEYYARNHEEFTTEELLNLIDELAEMGTKYISVNGGEALLRDDIEIIVDKIKEKKMLCHLSTNGLLVKKKISVLKKVNSLAVSIDGARQGNDLNRGEGTYDKIVEAIECLKENNIKFHTHTVLTKNNKNAADEMMVIARRYGCKAQFSVLRESDSPDKEIGLDDDEVREIVTKILDYKKDGRPVFFSYDAYDYFLRWPFSYQKQTIKGKLPEGYKPIECYIKRFSCHIEANGLVYPCVVLVNKFEALNFLEVGFKKAWENLSKNDCKACYNICCNDLNLTFGLKPQPIWNAVKIAMGRIATRIK